MALLAATALAGGLYAGESTTKSSGIEPFIKMRWPGNAELAPDQTLYFVYDPDGIRQLYKLAPGQPQSKAKKLTSFDDGIGGYNLSEDGRWIAITASVGGSQQADLFLLDTVTGNMETLFESPDVVFGGVVWRRDSQAFAYRANDANGKDFHVYLYEIGNKAHKPVFVQEGYNYAADFSKNGAKLVTAVATATVLGMTIAELDDPARQRFEISEDVSGVVVTEVAPDSAAMEKGIAAGDVITEIAQESVSTPQQVMDRIAALKEQGRKNALLMLASKNGELHFVTVRMN